MMRLSKTLKFMYVFYSESHLRFECVTFLPFHILVLNVKRREVMLLGTKPFLRRRGAFPKLTEVAQSFCIKNEDPDFLVKIYIGEGISNDTFFDSCVPAFSVSDEMYKSQHF